LVGGSGNTPLLSVIDKCGAILDDDEDVFVVVVNPLPFTLVCGSRFLCWGILISLEKYFFKIYN